MENKEQILEEAAELYYLETKHRAPSCKKHFIEGANWQQERMFSQEEVISIVEKSRATGLTAEYLIEQLKNK